MKKTINEYIDKYVPQKEEPVRVTIRLIGEDHEELSKKCEELGISLNSGINIAIRNLLDENPVSKRKLRE